MGFGWGFFLGIILMIIIWVIVDKFGNTFKKCIGEKLIKNVKEGFKNGKSCCLRDCKKQFQIYE